MGTQVPKQYTVHGTINWHTNKNIEPNQMANIDHVGDERVVDTYSINRNNK